MSTFLIASLSVTDMVTLSSTSSLVLIFNSLLACKMLKEKFTKYDLVSIILIGMGATLCVSFSSFKAV